MRWMAPGDRGVGRCISLGTVVSWAPTNARRESEVSYVDLHNMINVQTLLYVLKSSINYEVLS